MIPARFGPYVYSLILSGGMSFIVSGVAAFRALGAVDGFLGMWISAWLPAWLVAFFALLVLRPVVTRIVAAIVRA